MKNFKVSIEETIVQEFEIYAKDENNALETAYKKYKNREIVLEDAEVQYAQMAIVNSDSKNIEWVEI